MTIEHLPNPPEDPPTCPICGTQEVTVAIDADEDGEYAIIRCPACEDFDDDE